MATVFGKGNKDDMTDLKIKLQYRKSEKDDWTGVEDKALRKKIQNRLAKRKSRINGPKSERKHDPATVRKESSEIAGTSELVATTTEDQNSRTNTSDNVLNGLWITPFVNSGSLQDDVDNLVQSALANRGLAEHRWINLMEYSVLRAFIQNASLLAIDPTLFLDYDALSPWTLLHPYPVLTPHDLSPTALQLSTPHHPYLDPIAPPSLRDNVLLSVLTEEQEDQLCIDMHRGSFIIWGSQPWNALAWEISQTFVTKWPWLVSNETIRSSNFWRAERGEGPLIVPSLSGGILGEIL